MAGKKHRKLRLQHWRRTGSRRREGNPRTVFQKMPVGLYRTSADGVILDANLALLDLLGFPDKHSLLQLNIADLCADPSQPKSWLAKTEKDDVIHQRGLALCRTDGTVIRVDDYARAIRDENGKVLAYEGCMIDITGQSVTEDALREAETKYKTLVEQMPNVATYMDAVDPAISTFYISPQIQQMIGYSPQEWQRDPRSWRERIHPEDCERVLAADAHHEKTGEPFSQEYRLIARDGQTVWVRDESAMVFDEAGRPRFSHGVMIDITDRKKAEASLARQMAQLNALYEVSREVVTGHDPEAVYLAAHNAARQTLPVDAFMITLLDESRQEAQDVYLFDHGQTWPNERSPLSERGMMAHVISTCEPLLIEDDFDGTSGALGTTLFGDPQDPSETRSLLVVPLIINDRPIGVMSVQHYVPHMYSGEHVQSLMTLANQVAIAIEHARLVQSYRLRDAALNAAANAIVITDHQGNIEWANPAFTLLTGYTSDEAIGRNPRDLLRSGQQDASFYKQMWETILSGEVWHGHLINRRKDGSQYVEEMTITPMGAGNSKEAHFIAIKQDITERQTAERALRESEAKYRTVVEQASDGIAIVQRGIVQYANPRLADLRGEPLTEIIGRRFSLFVAPSERSKVMGLYRRRVAGEDVPRTYETVLLKKDQAPLMVELTPTSITYLGTPADIVMIRDISERKLAEQILQQQLREMVALNKVSAAAVKTTDLDEFIWSATLAVQETLHPDNCGVFLLDEDKQRWQPHHSYQGTNPEHLAESYPVSEGIVGKVLTSEKMARVPDVSREPFYREAMPGIQSEICVPIMVAGKVFGCLNAESRLPGAFSEHDEHLLRTMADSMSLAIEKIRLLKMEQQRREEAEMLYATTHDLVIDHDLSTLLQTIVLRAAAMLKASGGGLYMCEPERRTVRCKVSLGAEHDYVGTVLRYGEGAAGTVAETGKPLIIGDYRNWENRSPLYRDRNTTVVSVLSVPIRWQDRVIGVINIFENNKPRRYREEDVSIVTSFANQAAIAIENARLFEEEHRRRQEAAAITEVGRDISASLQLDVVLERITSYAKHLLHAELSAVYLADPGTPTLQPVVVLGTDAGVLKEHPLTIGQGILGNIALQRYGEIVNDAEADPRGIVLKGSRPDTMGYLMGVPVVSKDQLISLIAVWRSGEGREFKPSELDFLNGLAQQVAVAIENARLYENTRQRLLEIQAVYTVSSALRSARSIGEALPIILDQLMDIFAAGGATLEMVDPFTDEVVTELASGAWAPVTGLRSPPGAGVSGHVIATGQPYVSMDVVSDARAHRLDLFAGLNAVACVPVIALHQPIGALWVGRQTQITEDEVSLLAAIGEMVGNSLHRMRLNEQTEQRADQLASLRTIDQAITSSLDLQLTLNILLDQAISHLKVHAADILLINPATREFESSAWRGFHTGSVTRFPQQLREGLGRRVVHEKRALYIPNLSESVDTLEARMLMRNEGFVAYYGIPLIAKEQLVGVLECFQRMPLNPDADWTSFLEALARQAAIAIEKARLLDDLQTSNRELREAYDTTLEGWARALELRDKETEGHSRRVMELALRLARQFRISDTELMHMRRGVLLHDIGKMGVPDRILRKKGPLSEDEFAVMRMHPQYAYDLMYPIAYLRPALDIPYCHHERWDGTGYPQGLKGQQIPLTARIFAVVDVWDALLHDRPYRKGHASEDALAYIRQNSGTQFDPLVVDRFIAIMSSSEDDE